MCMHFTFSHVSHVLHWLRSVVLMQELMSPMTLFPHFKQWQVTCKCIMYKHHGKHGVSLYDASLLETVLHVCSQNGSSAQHYF